MKDNLIEFAEWWKSVYREKLAAVCIDERFTNDKRYEMKTITEWNNEHEIIQPTSLPLSGVLCDKCKVEMYYPEPNQILACIPPKMTVKCPICYCVNYKIR